jgi:hypothetical protein
MVLEYESQHLPEQNHPVMQVNIPYMKHMAMVINRSQFFPVTKIYPVVDTDFTIMSTPDFAKPWFTN